MYFVVFFLSISLFSFIIIFPLLTCFPCLQVSCEEELSEEEVEDIISTEQPSPALSFKEHVLLCVRVRVEGRAGVVLLDPGYHVPCPVTVMEDGLSPHSGPVLTATARSDVTRTYTYNFPPSSSSYVVWEVEEQRGGKSKWSRSLIHVSRPYLSGVDVTERRNLAYTFKTLLGRDAAGKFTAGLYFVIKPSPSSSTITFFHKVDGEMKHVKKPVTYFLQHNEEEEQQEQLMKDYIIEKEAWKSEKEEKIRKKREVDEEVEAAVIAVENGVRRERGDVRATLCALANLLQDKGFLADLLELNGALDALGNP